MLHIHVHTSYCKVYSSMMHVCVVHVMCGYVDVAVCVRFISIFNFYRLQCIKSILVVRSKTRLKHQCLIRTTNAVMSSTRPNACGVLNQRCLAVETMTLAARCGLHAAGFLVATRSMISPTSARDMTSQTPSLLKQNKQTENEKDESKQQYKIIHFRTGLTFLS